MNWLSRRAQISGGETALLFENQVLTFDQLEGRAKELARQLQAVGAGVGDRIAIPATSTVGSVVAMHAISMVRAVVVPLNTRLGAAAWSDQIKLVGARALLLDPAAVEWAESSPGSGPPVECSESLLFHRLSTNDERQNTGGRGHDDSAAESWGPTPQLSDLHCIIFTSGTTGAGKPVSLSYGNHWWNAFGSLLNLGSQPGDLWLNCLPLYHVGGLSILIRGVLGGVPVWLQPKFDPAQTAAALDSGRVTMVSLVSTMLYRLFEHRGSRPFHPNLRCVLLGGGPIPEALVRKCLELGVPIAPTYGMTETASQAATLRPDEVANHPRSAGKPLLGIDLTIDPTVAGFDFGLGEIVMSGPSVSRGPDDSTAPFAPLRTGDLGSLDAGGYLFVSDRRQDLIVTGGENVYPSEVDAVLLSHPSVLDAGVVGLPDEQWGQIVVAAIVPTGPDVEESRLRDFCHARLPGFKCPKRIHMLSELPRTSSGKLRRVELAELLTPST